MNELIQKLSLLDTSEAILVTKDQKDAIEALILCYMGAVQASEEMGEDVLKSILKILDEKFEKILVTS